MLKLYKEESIIGTFHSGKTSMLLSKLSLKNLASSSTCNILVCDYHIDVLKGYMKVHDVNNIKLISNRNSKEAILKLINEELEFNRNANIFIDDLDIKRLPLEELKSIEYFKCVDHLVYTIRTLEDN